MNSLLAMLYLQGGIAVMDQTQPAAGYWYWDINRTRNPYGTAEIGLETSGRLSLSFAVRHQSSIAVNDHGQNTVNVAVKWKPFQ